MTYRRALLGRWSRRDRLAILVIAVGVAFLCGTALLVVIASGQTTAIAAEFGTTGTVTTHDSVSAAQAGAPTNATVLTFARVTDATGQRRYVVGRPDNATFVDEITTGSGTTLGGATPPSQAVLTGDTEPVTLNISSRSGETILPSQWFVTEPATVTQLGVDGAFVIHPVSDGVVPRFGVPLQTALAFFVLGTTEALAALGVVVIGSAVLISVVVYSITRITVRERSGTLYVIRATGGTGRSLLVLFGIRAGLLTATGTALGYAIGIIGVNAAVNAAVFAGLPTSLSPRVTPTVATIIGPIVVSVIGLGILSGGLAALPATRGPPRPAEDRAPPQPTTRFGSLRNAVSPSLLDTETIIPTAATLTTFVAFVVLVSAMAGVLAPLSGGEGATITEPGAVHPIASTVPTTYAASLRTQGIAASSEFLLFEVDDGQPYTIRGANYSAFASVTDSSMTAGRRPQSETEAVIGRDLARTLNVGIGDQLTLGGSTREALTRVDIVGIYTAPGPYDDQLIVPLATATELAGKSPGTAQFVRAERLPSTNTPAEAIRVSGIRADEPLPPNTTASVQIDLVNQGSETVTTTMPITAGGQSFERTVTIPAGQQTTVTVPVETGSNQTVTIRAGSLTQTVTVGHTQSAGTLQFGPLPDRAPPNASLIVTVLSPTGEPIPNATVTARSQTVTTSADGRATVSTGSPGELTITTRVGNQTGETTIAVQSGVQRSAVGTLTITPESPTLLTQVTVEATVSNPWGTQLSNQTITVTGPGGTISQDATLPAGGTTTVTTQLDQQPPGTYEASLQVAGETLTTTQFRVTGDERIAAALAAGGRTGTTGIGRAIETAFGNLQLVFGVVLALASLLTIGGTTATFARAVHSRRSTIGIYRATGAGPLQILRLVVSDAIRIGILATLIALPAGLVGLQIARELGYLTVFGITLPITGSPAILAGAGIVGIGLTVLGAGVATASLLAVSPAQLLHDQEARAPDNAGDNR